MICSEQYQLQKSPLKTKPQGTHLQLGIAYILLRVQNSIRKIRQKLATKLFQQENNLDKHERPQESSEAVYLKGLIEFSRAILLNTGAMRLENKWGGQELPHLLAPFIFLRGTCLLLCLMMSLSQAIDSEKKYSFFLKPSDLNKCLDGEVFSLL